MAEAGTGVNGGAAHQIRLPKGVVHDQVGGGVPHDDQPVAPSAWLLHRSAVQVPAGDGSSGSDLRLDRLEACLLGDLGLDAVAGQSMELGRRIGGVAVPKHPLQVLIVAIRAAQSPRPQDVQQHGEPFTLR